MLTIAVVCIFHSLKVNISDFFPMHIYYPFNTKRRQWYFFNRFLTRKSCTLRKEHKEIINYRASHIKLKRNSLSTLYFISAASFSCHVHRCFIVIPYAAFVIVRLTTKQLVLSRYTAPQQTSSPAFQLSNKDWQFHCIDVSSLTH
jgi:hypothetical protein